MNNEYFYFWPPMQLPCFIVGFWTWHLAKDYLIGAKVLPLRACRWLVAGGLVMVAALFLAGTGRGMAHGVAPTFAAAATAALMLVLTRIASRTLQAPALVMLGRYSFGIYVWHFIAILGVRAVVRIGAVDDFAEYHGVLVFAVSMAVATVVAYAGARFTARRVEEPCSRWAREWLARDALRVPGRRGAAADGTEGI